MLRETLLYADTHLPVHLAQHLIRRKDKVHCCYRSKLEQKSGQKKKQRCAALSKQGGGQRTGLGAYKPGGSSYSAVNPLTLPCLKLLMEPRHRYIHSKSLLAESYGQALILSRMILCRILKPPDHLTGPWANQVCTYHRTFERAIPQPGISFPESSYGASAHVSHLSPKNSLEAFLSHQSSAPTLFSISSHAFIHRCKTIILS